MIYLVFIYHNHSEGHSSCELLRKESLDNLNPYDKRMFFFQEMKWLENCSY